MNEMGRKKESTPGENLAKQIIEQYNPKSVSDMQNALKEIFGPMFEAMLQGEMKDISAMKATITEQNQPTTAVTVTQTKRLRRVPAK